MNAPNNYKHFMKWYRRARSKADQIPPEQLKENGLVPYPILVSLLQKAERFVLPFNGVSLHSTVDEITAIPRGKLDEPLRLPFESITLEYLCDDSATYEGQQPSPRRIVYARELPNADRIAVLPVFYLPSVDGWVARAPATIPSDSPIHESGDMLVRRTNSNAPLGDYGSDVAALLLFLEALQCSNVTIERRDMKTGRGRVLDPKPEHRYHVLTVAARDRAGDSEHAEWIGDRHSPREHLRRGHIRRLGSGKHVWVNATVVNAGRGGRVEKVYKVGAPA